MKHTDGPWTFVKHGYATQYSVHGFVEGPDRSPVCGLWMDGQIAPEQEANARLIAAAPDLLDELRFIANANPNTWEGDMRDQFRQWVQSRARAAIRKAEGE